MPGRSTAYGEGMKNVLWLLGLVIAGMCCTPALVGTASTPSPVPSPSLSAGHYALMLDYDTESMSEGACEEMERLSTSVGFMLPREYDASNRALVSAAMPTYVTLDGTQETDFTLTASPSWGRWKGDLDVPEATVELELSSLEDPFTGEFTADVAGERVHGTYRLIVGW